MANVVYYLDSGSTQVEDEEGFEVQQKKLEQDLETELEEQKNQLQERGSRSINLQSETG